MITRDYSIKMRDSKGTTITLHINGASVDGLVKSGCTHEEASSFVESDAFYAAVDAAEIGLDAWIIAEADA